MSFAKLERPRTVSYELAALRKLAAKRRTASAKSEAARARPSEGRPVPGARSEEAALPRTPSAR